MAYPAWTFNSPPRHDPACAPALAAAAAAALRVRLMLLGRNLVIKDSSPPSAKRARGRVTRNLRRSCSETVARRPAIACTQITTMDQRVFIKDLTYIPPQKVGSTCPERTLKNTTSTSLSLLTRIDKILVRRGHRGTKRHNMKHSTSGTPPDHRSTSVGTASDDPGPSARVHRTPGTLRILRWCQRDRS